MSDAPPYNCAHKVTAAPSADGKYQFDASGLVSNGVLAVAILPTGPIDRVVLNAPDANSLTTQPSAAGSLLPDSGAVIAPTDTGAVPLPDTSGLATAAGPGFTEGLPGATATGPTSVSPAPAATPGQPGAGGFFVPTVASGPEKATPLLVVLFIVAGLGGAALWLYAGRPRREAVVTA